MANVIVDVPPPQGVINMKVNDTLTINANKSCKFCCTIGANFDTDISSITLNAGNNGPYTAQTAGSGMYNTSEKDKDCSAANSPTLTAKSVQIGG